MAKIGPEEKKVYKREDGALRTKSYAFAIRIVKMTQYLQREKEERVLTKQVLRSGTALGALVREAEFAQSIADFTCKLEVALKEANETEYWLRLLHDTEYLDDDAYKSIEADCGELIALLVASIKTSKRNRIKRREGLKKEVWRDGNDK